MNNIIDIKNLEYSYNTEKNVLKNLDLTIHQGEIVTIVGENGCGKSTLLNILAGNINYKKGSITIENKELSSYTRKQLAKTVSVVYQKNLIPEELTVRETISYGRLPYQKFLFKQENEIDKRCIDFALNAMDLLSLENEKVITLSGGQLQRVFIALALAQDTKILILDEPTIYLDIKYQKLIMELLKKINKEKELTIIMILHDINQALKYSDKVYVLKNGKITNNGSKNILLNSNVLEETFNTKLETTKDNIVITW